MIYTLEDLREGKCAVINDGTYEQLKEVMKSVFRTYQWYDTEKTVNKHIGIYNLFCRYENKDTWTYLRTDADRALPTQSVVEFYKQLQPQFEIGCWYQCNGTKDLFIKIKSIAKDGRTDELETIWSNGKYEENTRFNNIIHQWTKLTDLSVIQSFLPPNHPDLITMNKQYLTRKQLIELHKSFECGEWKREILNIINTHHTKYPLTFDEDKIEVEQRYIDLVNSKGGSAQKQLLQTLGIKLSNEIAVCDSKDGDCIKVSEREYYVNRNNIISIFTYNANEVLQLRYACLAKEISPDIRGVLETNPLLSVIKIN